MTRTEIAEWLKERVNSRVYYHSTATQEMAAELADIYEVDRQKAMLAGLLHDRAKQISNAKLVAHAQRYHIQRDHIRMAQPELLHAPVGAKLVHAELGITDEEILDAIAVHNTGSRDMSRLGKILYLADASEHTRDYPAVQDIRKLALSGELNDALLATMDMKIRHVLEKKRMLHPMSVEARNEVLKEIMSL